MYLYIFEDGSMLQNQNPPTPFDLACIDDGVLTVISQVGAKYVEVDGAGDMYDLPEGIQKEMPTTEGSSLMTVSNNEATNDS